MNHSYLWIPGKNQLSNMAKTHYYGPRPTLVWSLPDLIDPLQVPELQEMSSSQGLYAIREFEGKDYIHVESQSMIYYRGRLCSGDHWLRLEF